MRIHEIEEEARKLANLSAPPLCITLSGDLGAGKSTFARAFIRAYLQDHDLFVPSPTFTLVQMYESREGHLLVHSDWYRLNIPEEIFQLGIPFQTAITLIEWPEKAFCYLPSQRLDIQLLWIDEYHRTIQIQKTG